jgi:hypothetical protein
MAINPSYAAAPRCGLAQIATANPNRDGTGAVSAVFVAGAGGSRVDALAIKATATTTAGMVRLFIGDGANNRLLAEVPVQAVTPSAVAPTWEWCARSETFFQVLPIIIPPGYSLSASTHNGETFNVIVSGGDF